MYNKVPTDLNFVEREKDVEQFWEREHIFEKSVDSRKEGETYTLDVYKRQVPCSPQ